MCDFEKKNNNAFSPQVGTLIMDNDSTTMHHLREKVDPSIQKKTDANHTKKSMTGSLITLGSTYKQLNNPKIRNYIICNIMYALEQNQGQPERIRSSLGQIVPHIYGT